jgi:hypothetical protein
MNAIQDATNAELIASQFKITQIVSLHDLDRRAWSVQLDGLPHRHGATRRDLP